jgi:hypothetical protein
VESGAADMTEDDWDHLRYIARASGIIRCSGNRGRMTLADARRLELHGYVKTAQPEKRGYPLERPNRSWSAEVTDEGRKALEDGP